VTAATRAGVESHPFEQTTRSEPTRRSPGRRRPCRPTSRSRRGRVGPGRHEYGAGLGLDEPATVEELAHSLAKLVSRHVALGFNELETGLVPEIAVERCTLTAGYDSQPAHGVTRALKVATVPEHERCLVPFELVGLAVGRHEASFGVLFLDRDGLDNRLV
jgi:hypothetical protein